MFGFKLSTLLIFLVILLVAIVSAFYGALAGLGSDGNPSLVFMILPSLLLWPYSLVSIMGKTFGNSFETIGMIIGLTLNLIYLWLLSGLALNSLQKLLQRKLS